MTDDRARPGDPGATPPQPGRTAQPHGDENPDRYHLLVDAVTDYAIYMLDPDGIVTSWNAGAKRIKGYDASEVVGRYFGCFYTAEDQGQGVPATVLERARRDGRFESEGVRVRKDGSRFWAHVTVVPIRAGDGKITGFAKVTRDLTQRREAEEQLRRSEQQFRLLVQGVTDYAIYMLDAQGKVVSWNSGAERIKGYRPEEIIGRHFSVFYDPADRLAGDPERALQMSVQHGGFEKEGWRIRKDGSRFWAHVIVDPVYDDSAALIGYAKVTRDVTERREARESLERAHEELLHARKMDAIGQLTGGVAHDFNNLLMAIIASLELLQRRDVDPAKTRAMLDNAMSAAQRGVSLTQRMLAFARKQELELHAVHVGQLVGGMTELIRRRLGPTVALEIDIPDDLPLINADVNQLELVLLNLAANARDAMPNGGMVTISAAVRPLPDHASADFFVCLQVRDTGEGMDAATLERAAEPFFTTKGVGKGTGLGLSMAQGVVEQFGGRLRVASTIGVGTEVSLWLPVSHDAQVVEAASTPMVTAPGGTSALNVLAVDDDELVLTNLVAMLEELGHRVTPVHSGVEALAKLQEVPDVDLVITDFAMPRMTGLQLAQTIEAQWPGIPIIIASGYADVPVGTMTAVKRLAKPFGFAQLEAAIDVAMAST